MPSTPPCCPLLCPLPCSKKPLGPQNRGAFQPKRVQSSDKPACPIPLSLDYPLPSCLCQPLGFRRAEEGGLRSSRKGEKRKTSWRRTTRKAPWSDDWGRVVKAERRAKAQSGSFSHARHIRSARRVPDAWHTLSPPQPVATQRAVPQPGSESKSNTEVQALSSLPC